MPTPFNLEQALEGARIVTRSGLEVVKIAHFPTMPVMRQIVFAIEGLQFLKECDTDGRYYPMLDKTSSFDLFMRGTPGKVKTIKALRELAKGDRI